MSSVPKAIGAGALTFFMSVVGFNILIFAGKGQFTPQMIQGVLAISSILGLAVGYSALSDTK